MANVFPGPLSKRPGWIPHADCDDGAVTYQGTSVPNNSDTLRSNSLLETDATSSRSKVSWTPSLEQKLARLYLYTTLSTSTIAELIRDKDGSSPSKDVTSKKLNTMLDKDPRWLHPRNREDAERRLNLLRGRLDLAQRSKLCPPRPENAVMSPNQKLSHRSHSPQPQMKLEKQEDSMSLHHVSHVPVSEPQVPVETRELLRRHCGDSELEFDFILGEFAMNGTNDSLDEHADDSAVDTFNVGTIKADPWALRTHMSIMASHMLVIDLFRKEQGICMEGTDAHDYHQCLCSVSESGADKQLMWVTPNGLSTQAERILKFGPIFENDLTYCDSFGNTILHFLAARAHPVFLLRALIDHQELARLNTSGETFLHCLSKQWYSGEAIYLRVLLRHLASDNGPEKLTVFSRDIYGRSIFHLMTESGLSQEILSGLMEPFDSHDYAARDAFGVVPGETQAQTLSQSQAEKTDKTDTLSMVQQQAQLLETINRAYHDTRAEHEGGRNALHCTAYIALSTDSPLAFNFVPNFTINRPRLPLSKVKAKSSKKSSHKKTELNSKAKVYREKREDIMRDLVGAGVDINGYDSVGNTVLMHFVAHMPEDDDQHSVNIIDQMLELGADIQARNRVGETALHVAVRLGRKLAMKTLVLKGANVHARDKHGRTPLRTLSDEIQKSGNDSVTYAHLEACFAWLSGQGEAKLRSSVLDEWGWYGMPAVPAGRGIGKMSLNSVDEWYLDSRADKVIKCHARDGKSQVIIKRMREILEIEQRVENSKMEWAQLEDLTKIGEVKEVHHTSEVERHTITQPSAVVKIEDSEESVDSSDSSRGSSPSIDDVCCLVLRNAFNVSLDQVSRPEEAWESVRRCLNELSVITSLSHEHFPSPSEDHLQSVHNYSRGVDPEQTAMENSLLADGGQSSVNRNRKRRWSDASGGPSKRGDNNNNNNDDDDDDDEKNDKCMEFGSKTRKKGKTHGRYTCPYRKRNPLRFNIRQHPSCATVAHDSISLVKLFHQRTTANSFVCRRCQEPFPTSEALDNHIRVPSDQMCMIREQGIYRVVHHDPEDGITAEKGIKLADRKSRTQVLDWSTLWKVLFPEDNAVPSEDFEPVIELDEVKKTFADDSERCQSLVHDLSGKICQSAGFEISSKSGERYWRLFQTFTDDNLRRHNVLMACSQFLNSNLSRRLMNSEDETRSSTSNTGSSSQLSRLLLPTPESVLGNEPLPRKIYGTLQELVMQRNSGPQFSDQAIPNTQGTATNSVQNSSDASAGQHSYVNAFDGRQTCSGVCFTEPCSCDALLDWSTYPWT